ncbi:hypothetical protein PBY51_016659 [Eleginops maclovinus]|uniref:Uncharacterized protein n=1 Tax=Eleginops maclovinus TaxID=56733 RepID=A0AAN7WRN4_ELEMC|nr:hypothetical protein PBY51_016659 [Eleginops maclovinus]
MSCCRFDVRLSESYPNASSHRGCDGVSSSARVQVSPALISPSLHQLSFYLALIFHRVLSALSDVSFSATEPSRNPRDGLAQSQRHFV